MNIGERYEKITNSFNSIREDAKGMVDQLADRRAAGADGAHQPMCGPRSRRGDIADRFDDIRKGYLDVAKDTRGQIEREHTILEAYQGFSRRAEAVRGARTSRC